MTYKTEFLIAEKSFPVNSTVRYLCLLFLTIILLNSCSTPNDSASLSCDKLTSREEANALMAEVDEIRFTDSTTIVKNLIGEWGLIGKVPGWVGFEPGEACIRLSIDSDKIELKDIRSGKNSSSEWSLKVIKVNEYTGFYLETNEDVWNNRMGMQIFSEKTMFGNGRVDDGNTYIYEKLD